jgi:hypothetical protein
MRGGPTGKRTTYGNEILTDGTLYEPKPKVRLNRSQNWPAAATYQEARDASPSTRPVR